MDTLPYVTNQSREMGIWSNIFTFQYTWFTFQLRALIIFIYFHTSHTSSTTVLWNIRNWLRLTHPACPCQSVQIMFNQNVCVIHLLWYFNPLVNTYWFHFPVLYSICLVQESSQMHLKGTVKNKKLQYDSYLVIYILFL